MQDSKRKAGREECRIAGGAGREEAMIGGGRQEESWLD